MTPVERLQAAIEKLETLKSASTPGPWDVYSVPDTRKKSGYVAIGIGDFEAEVVRFEGGYFDADLIVTLHRTIHAQLAILRFAVDGLYDLPEFLMLADATLGGDS